MPRIIPIQIRRGTSSSWDSTNPVLLSGEPAFETDTGVLKIGNGLTAYKSLFPVNSFRENIPIGIEWDTSSSSPILKRIDVNGNEIFPSSSFFDNHTIWGRIRRCVRNRTSGAISYGYNARGDGLSLNGYMGDVLVELPTAKYKYEVSGTKRRFWIAPYNSLEPGFLIHPSAVQRGGTIRSKFYIGAYESGLRDDSGTLKFKSVSDAQPFTGTEGMYSRTFTSGSTAFTPDETLTGGTSAATAKVVDFHLTSGLWTGGDAAGVVYLKQPSGTFVSEDVNGSIAGTNCATFGGALSGVSLTLDQAETYAKNLGTGFGIGNVWTYSYLQLLAYIEYGTFDIQTALGKGIVDLVSGSGYAGKITGADSINSRLGTNGTGTGSGTNGQTPVCWRGIENIWGNCWEFISGLNMYLSDGSWRILKRDGTGIPAATLADGSYETGTGTVPISADGYISGIQSGEIGALAFIPSADVGSSSTYLCDYFWYPRYNPSIVLFGGAWTYGLTAGVGYRYANGAPSSSIRNVGARLEFLP